MYTCISVFFLVVVQVAQEVIKRKRRTAAEQTMDEAQVALQACKSYDVETHYAKPIRSRDLKCLKDRATNFGRKTGALLGYPGADEVSENLFEAETALESQELMVESVKTQIVAFVRTPLSNAHVRLLRHSEQSFLSTVIGSKAVEIADIIDDQEWPSNFEPPVEALAQSKVWIAKRTLTIFLLNCFLILNTRYLIPNT